MQKIVARFDIYEVDVLWNIHKCYLQITSFFLHGLITFLLLKTHQTHKNMTRDNGYKLDRFRFTNWLWMSGTNWTNTMTSNMKQFKMELKLIYGWGGKLKLTHFQKLPCAGHLISCSPLVFVCILCKTFPFCKWYSNNQGQNSIEVIQASVGKAMRGK